MECKRIKMIIKRFILVQQGILILQYIKMKEENNYTHTHTHTIMKIGITLEVIALGSGAAA